MHYEALIRIKDKNDNVAAPLSFIPDTESYGFMGKIDK
ncbi:EAL domain-containing protein (putative c-di-GMP-specific phosphodiesterase class I) [Clostridium punense]|uniref:EAL domain-containing protein (Putative c-di-GMP-specific phosphodiesterase class I) n=1 Tax=Clostridium punense TaxID=1054297 RepID=A0ABS4K6W6_9CLOT|nr:hypothetical protein M918_04690 [Clostridium sp. BL8]MBP2023533.1 EAL domain-containing protein (putative c-di-GMP-specific phosphodiesterase class I) [Clostridium punense]